MQITYDGKTLKASIGEQTYTFLDVDSNMQANGTELIVKFSPDPDKRAIVTNPTKAQIDFLKSKGVLDNG